MQESKDEHRRKDKKKKKDKDRERDKDGRKDPSHQTNPSLKMVLKGHTPAGSPTRNAETPRPLKLTIKLGGNTPAVE